MSSQPPRVAGPARHGVLECHQVDVYYGAVAALSDVELIVQAGEIVAVLGASGSGKSSLLQAVAGLVPIAAGEISVSGRKVSTNGFTVAPERRHVGMVFQDFALWPHLSVFDTVAYPLRRAGRSRREAAAVAAGLLSQLDIAQLGRRRPAELSGGEQQRVGLARALAREAPLYLLDEPTAHLDTHLRRAFQSAVIERQRESGAAALYATHDAAEALALADRIALIVKGRLIQVADPMTIYAQPATVEAARLTGGCSVLSALVTTARSGQVELDFSTGVIEVPGCSDALDGGPPRRRRLIVRPDWVEVGAGIPGRVTSVAFRGPHTEYHLATAGGSLLLQLPGAPRYRVADVLSWTLRRVWVIDDAPVEPVESLNGDDRPGVIEAVVDDVQMQTRVAP